MGTTQSTYGDMAIGQIGRRVNSEEWNGVTRHAEAAIPFGFPVMRGTTPAHQVKKFTGATGADILGFAEAVGILPSGVDAFAANDTVPVMTMGVMWQIAADACTAGSAVYIVLASGKVQDSSSGAVLIPDCEFDSTATTDGNLVKVRLLRKPGA